MSASSRGSYKLIATLTVLAVATAAKPDLQHLQRQDSLGDIDPKRAEIVEDVAGPEQGEPPICDT